MQSSPHGRVEVVWREAEGGPESSREPPRWEKESSTEQTCTRILVLPLQKLDDSGELTQPHQANLDRSHVRRAGGGVCHVPCLAPDTQHAAHLRATELPSSSLGPREAKGHPAPIRQVA